MIPEVNPYNNYRGDGVATLFDYNFFIQNGSQLIVEHIDENDIVTRLEENIDYEIVVIEEEFGGYIKFPIKDSKFGILQENETLSLQLTLPFEQISEYGQSSLLDLNSIEFSLDYLTRLCQILKRQIERSVRVSEGSEATPEQLLETINNNAIVSTNVAALASQKANEAMESANIASGKVEELQNVYNNAKKDIEQSSAENIEELNKIKEEAANLLEEASDIVVSRLAIDVSNATSETKENIISWSLPDYSAITTYTFGTAVPSDGYVCAQVKVAAGTTATITIDGVNTFLFGSRGTSPWTHSPLFPVCKGQVVDCNNTQGIDSSYFMPLKGAN